MIRILFLCEFGTRNGGENSLIAVLPSLPAEGIQPVVATPAPSELAKQLVRQQVETVSWNPRVASGQQDSIIQRREMVGQLIDTVQPDLVHANSLSMSRLAGPVTSRLGIPSVGHLRDMMNISGQAIRDLNQHARLLAVSQATCDWYVARGVDSQRIQVLYNGVALDQFVPGDNDGTLRRELALAEDVPILGGIGQLGLRKGWEILLEAMLMVRSDFPEVHLTIVGERHSEKQEAIDYEQQLVELAGHGQLRGHVHLLGRRDDVPALLQQWTALIHPARQEPLGRVLLEAAASGCPVVATEVGGTREIFPAAASDGALLVPPESPREMAESICQVLRLPRLRHDLAAAGQHRARRCFDVLQSAGHLVEHYRELTQASDQDLS